MKRERKKPASIDELAKRENLASIRKLLEREKELKKRRDEKFRARMKKLAKLFEPAIKELSESEKENNE